MASLFVTQDVAHIWELGGGSHVSDLVRVPITPERFHNSLYVIVVDLSKPSSVIPHLLHWTDQVKVRQCQNRRAKDPRHAAMFPGVQNRMRVELVEKCFHMSASRIRNDTVVNRRRKITR